MRNNKGITLIALVITIIVMLILVAVTITMAINGGLFTQAGKAAGDTQNAIDAEQELANLPANMSTDQLIAKYTTGQGGAGGGSTWTYTDNDSNGALSIGDLVTKGTENFYVIGGDTVGTAISSNTQNVILLAQYNLKKENGVITLNQNTDVDTYDSTTYTYSNACAFCSDAAWSGASVSRGDNLNDKPTISSEGTSAVGKAMAYGESLGGSGRLLVSSEFVWLWENGYVSIACGTEINSAGGLEYWLASPQDLDDGDLEVVCPNGLDRVMMGRSDGGFPSRYSDSSGVRPVIEISKSLVS